MSVEENKAIARRLVEEGWANPEIIDEIVAPDFVWHHDPEGREAYKGAWIGWFAGLPDARMTVEDMIAEGDKVVVRWACSGTQTGTLWGIPPTGKSVSITGTFTFRFAGGKIVENNWRNWDYLGLYRQLGLILPSRKELIEQAKAKLR
jgi:predicted ester cyclase